MFPLVFFNGVSVAEIQYDFSVARPNVQYELEKKPKEDMNIKYSFDTPVNKNMVQYSLTIDTTQENDHLEKRFLALETAVHNLFWKEVKVVVLFNNKKVYETSNV